MSKGRKLIEGTIAAEENELAKKGREGALAGDLAATV